MARYEKQITARDDTQSIPSAQRRTAYLADLFHYLADAREIRYISSALGSVALACAERARDAAREEEKKRRIILPRERERERGGGRGGTCLSRYVVTLERSFPPRRAESPILVR